MSGETMESTDTNKRYEDCYRLYLETGGRNVSAIEREMHALGHHDFNRRILYPRGGKPGWIKRYEWRESIGEADSTIPDSKFQISDIGSSSDLDLESGIWNLPLIWNLESGIWNFVPGLRRIFRG